MSNAEESAHDRAILEQFTQRASGFAADGEIHGRDALQLIIDAAAPTRIDRAIDLACGPGSVACALAERAGQVVGLDATPAMLDEACLLAAKKGLTNVEWTLGSVYAAPYAERSFDAVVCRYALHHLMEPPKAFAEMLRLAAPGGRVVVCDGVASDDPAKAAAFNAMERRRDPSTVEFRTLDYLKRLFLEAGLGEPRESQFLVGYRAADLVQNSVTDEAERAALLALYEASVEGDRFGMAARRTADGVRVCFPSVVLSAVMPARADATASFFR